MFTLTPVPPPNIQGQAQLIIETNAISTIIPYFLKPNEAEMAIEQAEQADITSWMGTPVFDTLVFDEISYKTFDNITIKCDKLTLSTVLLEVIPTKNIITTPIPGADGTVKEYIGMGDYQINITGALIGQHAGVPPTLEMKKLMTFIKAPISLNVYSNFLAHFEVFSLVINGEPRFSQVEGKRNVIGFSIPCISDKDFKIDFIKNNQSVSNSSGTPSFLG